MPPACRVQPAPRVERCRPGRRESRHGYRCITAGTCPQPGSAGEYGRKAKYAWNTKHAEYTKKKDWTTSFSSVCFVFRSFRSCAE
jgi:hypothetical protein